MKTTTILRSMLEMISAPFACATLVGGTVAA
jgi:hypothetical protein